MTWRTYIAKKFAKCTRVYLAPRNLKQVPGAIGVIEHIYAWPPGRAHNHDIWGGAQFIPRGFSHIIVGSPPCKQVLWELNLNPHESAWHVWRFKSSQGYGEVVGMVITINDVHERTLYVFLYFVCFRGLLPRVLRREHAYVFHSPPQSFTTTGDNWGELILLTIHYNTVYLLPRSLAIFYR